MKQILLVICLFWMSHFASPQDDIYSKEFIAEIIHLVNNYQSNNLPAYSNISWVRSTYYTGVMSVYHEDVNYIEIANGTVTLTINAAPLTYEFVCKDSNGREVTLGTGVTKDLSVERIGFDYGMCFTGTYFGLYATGNGKSCSVPADFDWFEYH